MTRKLATLSLAAALVTALATPAWAASQGDELPDATKTSVGGQLFTDYVFPMGSFAPQAFEIKRARIYGNVKFNDHWAGSIVTNTKPLTVDVKGKTTNVEAENVYLEMGYLQGTNLWPGSRMQFGMIITPWFEYEAKAWGYRMLGFLPDAGGLSPDAHGPQIVPFYDFGMSVQGDYKPMGIPLGYSLAVFNGEGQHQLESDGQKDFEGRLMVSPLPGLEITGMVHKHNPSGSFNPAVANRELLMAVYQRAGWKVALEGNWDQDTDTAGAYGGHIYGGWLTIPVAGLPVPTEVVLRADQIEGDQTTLDPARGYRIETIAGLAFTPANLVRIVLNNQRIDYHPADGSSVPTEDIVGIHTEVRF